MEYYIYAELKGPNYFFPVPNFSTWNKKILRRYILCIKELILYTIRFFLSFYMFAKLDFIINSNLARRTILTLPFLSKSVYKCSGNCNCTNFLSFMWLRPILTFRKRKWNLLLFYPCYILSGESNCSKFIFDYSEQ